MYNIYQPRLLHTSGLGFALYIYMYMYILFTPPLLFLCSNVGQYQQGQARAHISSVIIYIYIYIYMNIYVYTYIAIYVPIYVSLIHPFPLNCFRSHVGQYQQGQARAHLCGQTIAGEYGELLNIDFWGNQYQNKNCAKRV